MTAEPTVEVSLKAPFTGIIYGPTGSGKSVVCKKLLESNLIYPPIEECIFYYGCWQRGYDSIKTLFPIKFVEGLDNLSDLKTDGKNRLLIIDDLLNDLSDSSAVSDLYTKFSHHLNYSVVILIQNLFNKGKFFRTVSLNVQYLWILKSVRDSSIITTLGKQMGCAKFLKDCYEQATSQPWGCLMVDLKPGSIDKFRFRAQIFDHPSIVFLKR